MTVDLNNMPSGDFVGVINGTIVKTTRECAAAVFREHAAVYHRVTLEEGEQILITAATAHFATGWKGTTNDDYYKNVLLAFGLPIPEYPAELRAQHEARTAEFWGGVAAFTMRVKDSARVAPMMSEILENGQRDADAKQ